MAAFEREFLTREVERTLQEYSWTWEGEHERVDERGFVSARHLEVPWFDLNGMISNIRLDPDRCEEQLDLIVQELAPSDRSYWFIVSPSTQPADIGDLLVARGLQRSVHWAGLALNDMSVTFPINEEVHVELLSTKNVEEYAECCAAEAGKPQDDPAQIAQRAERVAAAYRYLADPQLQAQTQILLARLDGKVASCVVGHIEKSGVLYLRNAFTLPEFRNRGIYMTMVAHRLRLGAEAGCRAAVVQAQTHSSAPILLKRGFEKLCDIYAYTWPAPAAASEAQPS